MNVDVIIIGQGLAGSVLGYELLKRGKTVAILDDGHQTCATAVAAGLMDYISGMRLTLAWRSETLLPFASSYYKNLEAELGARFFSECPTKRIFTTPSEADIYQKKKDLEIFKPYYGNSFEGGVEIHGSCFLDTKSFLAAMKAYLKDSIHHMKVDYSQVLVSDSGVKVHDYVGEKVIFCNGWGVSDTPWFRDLPYRPAKGETLTLKNWGESAEWIYNFGRWMVPLRDDVFKFGATYEWDDIDCEPTEDGRQQLLAHLKRHFDVAPEVLDHEAAVRCIVPENRPLIGLHHTEKDVGIFSGFGSKGVMMVPYFAEHFVSYLLDGTDLDPEISVERYFE